MKEKLTRKSASGFASWIKKTFPEWRAQAWNRGGEWVVDVKTTSDITDRFSGKMLTFTSMDGIETFKEKLEEAATQLIETL